MKNDNITISMLKEGFPEVYSLIFESGYNARRGEIYLELENHYKKGLVFEAIPQPDPNVEAAEIEAFMSHRGPITPAVLDASHPEFCEAIRAAGRASADLNRTRFEIDYDAQARAKSAADMKEIIARVGAKSPSAPIPVQTPTRPPKALSLQERAKIEWKKSPALRAEFAGDFRNYIAYLEADAAGFIRFSR